MSNLSLILGLYRFKFWKGTDDQEKKIVEAAKQGEIFSMEIIETDYILKLLENNRLTVNHFDRMPTRFVKSQGYWFEVGVSPVDIDMRDYSICKLFDES
ncbi:hypothetical protein M3M39_05000 [Fructilactobacillus hinvesii]|uniref:Uncharacterized protein n=1 Tax=Fructilactobacillus hinvesii TaxID=2940300 RepID=A0ABY5BSR0_9LACO|nr:hypothetical protein [Fructilactobacillus hinvesii]USS87482.1 hypothetical protein M3M39_05000 [Fructilactobacillus hinvesii]